ncbi:MULTISPECIES: carbohydrate kinase family protein [unclassified Halomonas]|uniref:carbohydrate kinase family protein n=1 Tax=unclassified Halomonas TaxID=2609666 RepID=UPI00099050EC|nr:MULTISPECIES: carbohydrate kinase [unclassified Halomonas]AQU82825.1 carbohydrate kinase [Halomonas sp. 'Soap Lake \
MTPVIAFGEALVDMLSSRLGDDTGQETFTPYAGGAPANVAVACARLGVPSQFLGMVGDDTFGHFLVRELNSHGVDTSGVMFTKQSRTALAFVSRDSTGERTFDFYRPPAADLLYRLDHLPHGVFENPAIVHLCSNSLTDPEIADTTLAIASMANRAGCLVSVDANLRHNLWAEGSANLWLVTELLDSADLVKVSLEELDYLRGGHSQEAWLSERLAAGVKVILITDGPNNVVLKGIGLEHTITPPQVTAVDTTAGGDAFIGGLLAELSRHGIDENWQQDSELLIRSVDIACRCGAHAVTRPGAYAALPTHRDIEALRNT